MVWKLTKISIFTILGNLPLPPNLTSSLNMLIYAKYLNKEYTKQDIELNHEDKDMLLNNVA